MSGITHPACERAANPGDAPRNVLHLQARPPGTAFETRASVPREGRSIARTLADAARMIFWLGLCVIVVQQVRGPARLDDRRADVLQRFQQQRKSRAIALILRPS